MNVLDGILQGSLAEMNRYRSADTGVADPTSVDHGIPRRKLKETEVESTAPPWGGYARHAVHRAHLFGTKCQNEDL